MLRPKKHLTRKDIQRDPFLETVDQAQAHLEQNRNLYVMLGIGLIVILIGFNIVNSKRQTHSVEASSSLGQALIALERDDLNTARFQLETVKNDFENTESGHLSNYYLGKLKYESEELEEAKVLLNKFLDNNSYDYLVGPAHIILSDIMLRDDDLKQAINIINEGLRSVNKESDKITLELQKAKLLLKNGDKALSRSLIDNVLNEENLGSDHKKVAEEIFGKLTS